MIQHFTRSQADAHACLFESMHIDRKRVFVDALAWDIPHDGVREVDQYDTDAADYLILRDSDTGHHLGSVRLLPTTAPHILGNVFPFLCEESVPRGPHIREITRLVVSPAVRPRDRRRVRNMLGRAMIEFGALRGVKKYTAVCEMGFLTQLLASGWRIDPLGFPQNIEGSLIGAVLIHLDADSLALTSDDWRYDRPVLRIVEQPHALTA